MVKIVIYLIYDSVRHEYNTLFIKFVLKITIP